MLCRRECAKVNRQTHELQDLWEFSNKRREQNRNTFPFFFGLTYSYFPSEQGNKNSTQDESQQTWRLWMVHRLSYTPGLRSNLNANLEMPRDTDVGRHDLRAGTPVPQRSSRGRQGSFWKRGSGFYRYTLSYIVHTSAELQLLGMWSIRNLKEMVLNRV